MNQLPSFFNLDALTRYRLVTACGGVILMVSVIGRYLSEEPIDTTFYTRIIAITAFFAFAGLAQIFQIARRNPDAFVLIAITPFIYHMSLMVNLSSLEPGTLVGTMLSIVICAGMMDSRVWLRAMLGAWFGSAMVAIWSVATPHTSAVNASVVLLAVVVFTDFVTISFNTARHQLDQLAQMLEESQSFSGVGAWQQNLITNQTVWTKTAFEILEIPPDKQADSKYIERLFQAEEDGKLYRATQTMLATGNPYDVIDQIQTPSGKSIWIHARGKVKLSDGVPIRAMGVFTEITEQIEREHALTHAKEEAEAAATARAHFIANMSHEIRTPMNGVLGMASMLAQENLEPEAKKLVDVIRSSGESLLDIINDILDFSKLEAGKLELESRPFRLETLISSAVEVLRQNIEEKRLNLSVYLPSVAEDGPTTYLGDDVRIRQVLLNLLSNAVKFTEGGDITINVSTKPRGPSDHWVAVSVSDTGVGIPATTQATLFDAFTQADASTTRQFGGTGLGLAICRELIEQMQGSIEVHSRAGLGSTFTFRVPLKVTTEAPMDSVTTEKTAASVADIHLGEGDDCEKSLRILLAEDNPVNQKVAAMMLKKLGYATELADNGREAVAAAETTPFDVIFMDLQMPELDGIQATRAIRANEHIAQPCIIALTANAMDEDKQRCFEAGMDYFVAKPMRMADLQEAIEQAAVS